MSYTFRAAGTPIWDPALRVGELYLGQAEAVAALLEVPSGLTPRQDGRCDLEPEEFGTFVQHLLRFYNRGHHAALSHLLRGVVLVSLVLLNRAGGHPVPHDGETLDALLTEATALDRTMSV
ncbi:DUF6086 family protein [Micromonospora chersina]|uniref:DUF6086 family protein n=1 Tax=Micromonospora chersina TaxID=47854 RepID=UPI0033F0EB83